MTVLELNAKIIATKTFFFTGAFRVRVNALYDFLGLVSGKVLLYEA